MRVAIAATLKIEMGGVVDEQHAMLLVTQAVEEAMTDLMNGGTSIPSFSLESSSKQLPDA